MAERLLVPVNEAAELLGLGRTRTWMLAREGRLRVVRIGRRTLIPREELERFVRELQQEAEGARRAGLQGGQAAGPQHHRHKGGGDNEC